jgi:uncharacterized RDD family membrane protein YckC
MGEQMANTLEYGSRARDTFGRILRISSVSLAVEESRMASDAFDIGWWVESVDDEIYGPVSRETLRRYLTEGVISTNTLVRHCTQTEFQPVADAPAMTGGVGLPVDIPATGDRLAEAWPSRTRDRLKLAESGIPCYRHARPAVLVCLRCQAPYCNKCRAKPLRSQFYFCRRCQASIQNRRFGAFIVDMFLFNYIPQLLIVPFLVVSGGTGISVVYLVQAAGGLLFLLHDALFRGAGPGKRLAGIQVVQAQDGVTPLTYWQGIVRSFIHAIPLFNLVDASVSYRDSLQRRYGDRWAKTRVIDTPRKLEKDRVKAQLKMAKKGIEPVLTSGMTMEQFARIAE